MAEHHLVLEQIKALHEPGTVAVWKITCDFHSKTVIRRRSSRSQAFILVPVWRKI
jgi:hypothetical protein